MRISWVKCGSVAPFFVNCEYDVVMEAIGHVKSLVEAIGKVTKELSLFDILDCSSMMRIIGVL